MNDYRIYYADGTTYSGDPSGAPAWGVLVIVETDPEHGRRLVTGKDYYIRDGELGRTSSATAFDGRWWSVDQIGMLDYLARPGWKRVLFGRTVGNEAWYEAMRRANEDPDFPARTAWGMLEEKL